MKTAKLLLEVDYNPDTIDPDQLAEELDRVLKTGLSTPGILDACGEVEVGEFFPIEEDPRKVGDAPTGPF